MFDTVLTPKVPELIAAPNRFNNDEHAAKQHFEDGFRHAFTSLDKKMDARFPLTVYYAFRQDDELENHNRGTGPAIDATTGWETLLEALISSGFQITATWPVRASQKWRQVSMGKNALASYIVLACRPRAAEAPNTDRRSFISDLRLAFPAALANLQQGNVAPVDLAQAALGPGMAIYSRYAQVLDATGKALSVRDALKIINQMIDEISAEQHGDLDVESRWAIAWFEENGFEPSDYGVAETLSKAKNTSISALTQRGILDSRGGKVRLLKPAELSNDARVATESWTAWEIVHHCIRMLQNDGEGAVADLVAKLGPAVEIARELAYRLFTICERAKRSVEALSYNSLVQSWPEIIRLSRDGAQGAQPDLFGER